MKTDLTRRGFFKLVAGAAALVSVPSIASPVSTIYADGVHCDADGIEALCRGEVVEFLDSDNAVHIGWRGDHELSFGNVKMHCWRTAKIYGINNADIRAMNIHFHGKAADCFLALSNCGSVQLSDSTIDGGGFCFNSLIRWDAA